MWWRGISRRSSLGFVLDEGLREYIFALTDGYPGAEHALLEYVAMVSLLSGDQYV